MEKTVPPLESEIPELEELNKIREEALQMLDDGRLALRQIKNLDDGESTSDWYTTRDHIEAALLLQAQWLDKVEESNALVRKLEGLRVEDLFTENPHEIPIFSAARVMQALVGTSEYAFSRTTMICYYRIVREIYTAIPPDWSAGGASAASGRESTAFVTGECIRAISLFEDTLKRTARFFLQTYSLWEEHGRLCRLDTLKPWHKLEIERLLLSWYASTDVRLGAIALSLTPRDSESPFDLEYADKYLGRLSGELIVSIEKAERSFNAALCEIDSYRQHEKGTVSSRHFDNTESAHKIARYVVLKAVSRAEDAARLCRERERTLPNLERLGELFKEISLDVRKLLEPAKRFVGSILDRELTAATARSNSQWDAPELAFAAATYGATTCWREDERLQRACELLASTITEAGELPAGRPFHSTSTGFRVHPVGFEVTRGCAQVFGETPFKVDCKLALRMLQLFRRHKQEISKGAHVVATGWCFEHPPMPKKPAIWATAVAVMALDRLVQMLDSRINSAVLRHFDYTLPRNGKLRLESLLYPDYGLSAAPAKDRPANTIAVFLEQMRAHVLHIELPKKYDKKIFSMLLYGPPGTGKTTLLEALAKSSEVPVVRVSPSDIAIGGEGELERRARAIFAALAMLTKSVIIFDEFEPVLLNRAEAPAASMERSHCAAKDRDIFTFLTPAMLPKLTRLHDNAERRQIAYCLVTNHYEKLDSAAIRPGRFDYHLAIYHPDPLSRAGFLMRQLLLFKSSPCELSDDQWKRFEVVIRETSGSSVQELARSWSIPKRSTRELNPVVAAFEYILNGNGEAAAIARRAGSGSSAPLPELGGLEGWLRKWENLLQEKSFRETLELASNLTPKHEDGK